MDLSVGRMRVNGVVNPELVTVEALDDGTEILTFPVKALREKILECLNCMPSGEFVPASEITKALSEWDGKPLTIDHPVNESGELEFANRDETFLNSVKVGEVTNPRFLDGFLWVDAQLNKTLASRSVAGQGIIDALLTGKVDVEVSTGYGMELESRTGIHDGNRYSFAQKDIEPDHLALLPIGTVGACSVEDGCGAARAARRRAATAAAGGNKMNPKAIMDLVKSILKLNGADIEEEVTITEALASGVEESGDDVTANVGAADGDTATDPPAIGDDLEPGSTGGTPDSQLSERDMEREKLIASLVAAAAVPFVQDELEVMDDEKLTSLATLAGIDCGCEDAPVVNSDVTAAPAVEPVNEFDAGEEDEAGSLSAEDMLMIKQFISQAPALIDAANTAQSAVNAEREEMVASLTANSQCAVSETDLQGMTTSALRSLSKSFEAVDYSGRGGPRSTISANSEEDGYMPLPSWGEKEGVIYG